MEGLQTSVPRGQSAEWLVGAWTTGANVSDAAIRLSAAPAGENAAFSLGCSTNGKASCDLGAVAASSPVRLLQARIAIPAGATSVTSVRLDAVASAANVVTDPQAAVTISVAAPGGKAVPAQITPLGGRTGISPLPVGYLPFLTGTGATLSPGGNASGLFPVLSPSADPGSSPPAQDVNRPVAATFPLSETASVTSAQIAGLAALGLAIALAVSGLAMRRLTIRRRATPTPSDGS